MHIDYENIHQVTIKPPLTILGDNVIFTSKIYLFILIFGGRGGGTRSRPISLFSYMGMIFGGQNRYHIYAKYLNSLAQGVATLISLLIFIGHSYLSGMCFGVAPRTDSQKIHVSKEDWFACPKYYNHSRFNSLHNWGGPI